MSPPMIDISQYEISIIKQAWLALNLFTNYHNLNTTGQNGGPKVINNDFNLREFEQNLATKIYHKSATKDLLDLPNFITGTHILDNDLFNSHHATTTPSSISDSEISAIINDYQLEPLLQFITIMINHLEFNMIQPGQSMITNFLNRNVRLYDMSFAKYQLWGECLIESMVDKLSITDASKFQGEEQFIFNKFLSQVLSFLAYHSKESTVAFPNDSAISNNRDHAGKRTLVGESYPGPTISDMANVTSPYSHLAQPVKPSTRSSSSSARSSTRLSTTSTLPSDKSSQMSLHHTQSFNNEPFDHLLETDINKIHNPQPSAPEKKTNHLIKQDDKELSLARSVSLESITDDTYDYLNSFRCYKTPIEESKYAKLKRSFSKTSSSSSSRRKWSLLKRKGNETPLQSQLTQGQSMEKQHSKNGLYRIISRR